LTVCTGCHDEQVTAHGIPDDPQFATESEREVWSQVLEQGGDDWTVLANVRLTDEGRDHEADLVVLMPDVGVLVVEVKGGSLHVDDRGTWWQTSGHGGTRKVHPVDQARDTKYALRHYIESDPRWRGSSRTRVRFRARGRRPVHRPPRGLRDSRLPALDDPRTQGPG
jgi:hypothetical protein